MTLHTAKCMAQAAVVTIEAADTLAKDEFETTSYLKKTRRHLQNAIEQVDSLLSIRSEGGQLDG